MEKKNTIPQQAQPVARFTPGTQADLLAELSEENLSAVGVAASFDPGIHFCRSACSTTCFTPYVCSFDGDDAE